MTAGIIRPCGRIHRQESFSSSLGTTFALALPVSWVVARRSGSKHRVHTEGSPAKRFVRTILSTGAGLARRPGLGGKTLALSLVIHVSVIAYHFLLARGLGIRADFAVFFVVVPIISFALALPITVAGLGVFEGAMVLLLTSLAGVSPGEVLALCALHRLMGVPQRLLVAAALWVPTSASSAPDVADDNRREISPTVGATGTD